jgi:3-oxoacyl-[acyl-carrier protein] reductase
MVTGASKGIGYHTASRFLQDDNGATDVVLVARGSRAFDAAMAELSGRCPSGKTVHRFEVDLSDREAVLVLAKDVMARFGGIDTLVNNAGFTAPASIQQIAFEDFERTIAVNLYAPFTLVQELLHRGNRFDLIVNVASTAGINGRAGWLTYSASKAGLIAMSEAMREELALLGTRVVCISPGRCATDLRKVLAPDEDPSTIMQPSSVADVVAMLASDTGRFIDSQNLVVRA